MNHEYDYPGKEDEDGWTPDYTQCPRRVVCAAMFKEGRLILGARHFDRAMRHQMMNSEGLKWWRGCEQGFIDQFGHFMTREEAWVVANEQGQIFRISGGEGGGALFSENLY